MGGARRSSSSPWPGSATTLRWPSGSTARARGPAASARAGTGAAPTRSTDASPSEMMRLRPARFAVEIDGAEGARSAAALVVSNVCTYGKGMEMVPGAAADDGAFGYQLRERGAPWATAASLLAAQLRRTPPRWAAQLGEARRVVVGARGDEPSVAARWRSDGARVVGRASTRAGRAATPAAAAGCARRPAAPAAEHSAGTGILCRGEGRRSATSCPGHGPGATCAGGGASSRGRPASGAF